MIAIKYARAVRWDTHPQNPIKDVIKTHDADLFRILTDIAAKPGSPKLNGYRTDSPADKDLRRTCELPSGSSGKMVHAGQHTCMKVLETYPKADTMGSRIPPLSGSGEINWR